MYTLPDLPYEYDALEPYIDARTMEIHYTKHHQGYLNNLNKLLEGHEDLMNMDLEELLTNLDQVPEDLLFGFKNNAGGHFNHSLFWQILSPNGGGKPTGNLMDAITKDFESYENFVAQFETAALQRFGSGWAWLCYKDGKLNICSTKNQNNPLMHGSTPLMGIDVWEHAYYLKYQNRRGEYIKAFWNIVNWGEVSRRFEEL